MVSAETESSILNVPDVVVLDDEHRHELQGGARKRT